jgi:hypothetical protein
MKVHGTRTKGRGLWRLLAGAVVLLDVAVAVVVIDGLDRTAILDATFAVAFAVFAVVGVAITNRQPRHTMGRLLLGFAAVGVMVNTVEAYSDPTRGLPGAEWTAWVSAWAFVPGFAMLVAVILLFPDGRLPSQRWVWPARVAVAAWIATTLLLSLEPEPEPGVTNPFGGVDLPSSGPLALIAALVWMLFLASTFLALAALVVRYRRADVTGRLQVRWIALAGGLVILGLIATAVLYDTEGPFGIAALFLTLAIAFFPLAVGAAVLRYRLFDIDRILSRTAAFALVAGVLGAVYFVAVLGVGELVAAFSAGDESTLVTSLSTLVAATAFGPTWRRVRNAMERKFNRRRYDVARTLEEFGKRAGESVDVEQLRGEVVTLLGRTMEPATVGVWLRPVG